MQCKPTRVVLRASTEQDITARVDLLMEAFWDKTKDIEDIIARIKRTHDELCKLRVAPLITIKHCEKLLASVTSFSWTEQDMPYTWFVTAILHATEWIPEAQRESFVTNYLLVEPDDVPVTVSTPTAHEDIEQSDDFGFLSTADEPQAQESIFFVPLLYLLSAIGGMISLYNMRNDK